MIDHVSVAVRDLGKAQTFYSAVLAPLGFAKPREWPDAAVGFGKKHPEFWLNKRRAMEEVAPESGVHICLRAPDTAAVDAFHAAAAQGRWYIRRRTGAAPTLLRGLLRGLHPRSGWQPHRGGDLCAGGGRVAVTAGPPELPFASPPRSPRARLCAASAGCLQCSRRRADRRRSPAPAPGRARACARSARSAGPRSR